MSAATLAARWSNWGPQLRSVLRIVAALIFVQAGTMKLFAFPAGMPPNGGTASSRPRSGSAGSSRSWAGPSWPSASSRVRSRS